MGRARKHSQSHGLHWVRAHVQRKREANRAGQTETARPGQHVGRREDENPTGPAKPTWHDPKQNGARRVTTKPIVPANTETVQSGQHAAQANAHRGRKPNRAGQTTTASSLHTSASLQQQESQRRPHRAGQHAARANVQRGRKPKPGRPNRNRNIISHTCNATTTNGTTPVKPIRTTRCSGKDGGNAGIPTGPATPYIHTHFTHVHRDNHKRHMCAATTTIVVLHAKPKRNDHSASPYVFGKLPLHIMWHMCSAATTTCEPRW